MGKSIKDYFDTYCRNGGTSVKPGVVQLFASAPYLESLLSLAAKPELQTDWSLIAFFKVRTSWSF